MTGHLLKRIGAIGLLAVPALLATSLTAGAAPLEPDGQAANYIEGTTYCGPGQHVYVEVMVKDKVMAQWTPDPTWDSNYIQSIVFYNSRVKSAARVDLNIQGGLWAIAGVPGTVDWAHGSCAG
ncbi:hypothetical protein [Kribbella sp. DT2]|uniref:hypothetical protein n=1 Tax=Kribbella sp. DT2 TaxID=3393427 RepID=UPI003CEE06BE